MQQNAKEICYDADPVHVHVSVSLQQNHCQEKTGLKSTHLTRTPNKERLQSLDKDEKEERRTKKE